MKTIKIVTILFFSSISLAQKLELKTALKFSNNSINIGEKIELNNKYKLNIKEFKIYLNTVTESVMIDTNYFFSPEGYQLIQFEKDAVLKFDIIENTNKRTKLLIGVDSMTNVSGVMGDDLDPMWGMYWSWQSGFINAKITGVLEKEQTQIPFEFHLGGYQFPFYNAQQVELVIPDNPNLLVFDLAPLLDWVLKNGDEIHVMSPCENGQVAMKKLVDGIRIE